MLHTRRSLALALGLIAAIPAGAALASSDQGGRENRSGRESRMPANIAINAAAAISAVQAAGYTAITELDWERGAWEVKASDPQGQRARLRVDATTGAVSRRERR
jgi:uncharacterized membrane protein YkoI